VQSLIKMTMKYQREKLGRRTMTYLIPSLSRARRPQTGNRTFTSRQEWCLSFWPYSFSDPLILRCYLTCKISLRPLRLGNWRQKLYRVFLTPNKQTNAYSFIKKKTYSTEKVIRCKERKRTEFDQPTTNPMEQSSWDANNKHVYSPTSYGTRRYLRDTFSESQEPNPRRQNPAPSNITLRTIFQVVSSLEDFQTKFCSQLSCPHACYIPNPSQPR
jgi:hypothetical protein